MTRFEKSRNSDDGRWGGEAGLLDRVEGQVNKGVVMWALDTETIFATTLEWRREGRGGSGVLESIALHIAKVLDASILGTRGDAAQKVTT